MLRTISITVKGRVQGVFYRQSAREKAVSLGVRGLVRNLADSSVHIVATGTPEQLDQLTSWCWEGPARAVVTQVEVIDVSLQHFDDFRIER